eukprot:6259992-Ditylum_brightwellii.AAC.1
MTRDAKEEEITIILAIKASHIMWRTSIVALAPRVAVAVALQATVTFQSALVLDLAQMKANKLMIITMWITPTWIQMMERHLSPVTQIKPNYIGL